MPYTHATLGEARPPVVKLPNNRTVNWATFNGFDDARRTAEGYTWSEPVVPPETDQQKASKLIAAAAQAARSTGVPLTLPTAATLDGVDASGQTVHLSYEPNGNTETDWVKYGLAYDRGKAAGNRPRALEKFDSKEGRCTVNGADIEPILDAMAEAASLALEQANDLKALYRQGQYATIISQLGG